jgi:hypothetical protein
MFVCITVYLFFVLNFIVIALHFSCGKDFDFDFVFFE